MGLKITLADAEEDFVRHLAEKYSLSFSDIVRTSFVFGVPKLLEYLDMIHRDRSPLEIQDLIIRLAVGEDFSDEELIRLSAQIKSSYEKEEVLEALYKIRSLIKRRNGNGQPANVH